MLQLQFVKDKKTKHKHCKHIIQIFSRYETCTTIIKWSSEAYIMSDELPLTTIMSVRFSPLIPHGAYKSIAAYVCVVSSCSYTNAQFSPT